MGKGVSGTVSPSSKGKVKDSRSRPKVVNASERHRRGGGKKSKRKEKVFLGEVNSCHARRGRSQQQQEEYSRFPGEVQRGYGRKSHGQSVGRVKKKGRPTEADEKGKKRFWGKRKKKPTDRQKKWTRGDRQGRNIAGWARGGKDCL